LSQKGWHARRYSKGRGSPEGPPRSAEHLKACRPGFRRNTFSRILRQIARCVTSRLKKGTFSFSGSNHRARSRPEKVDVPLFNTLLVLRGEAL
jgi:hypothetical protein